MLGEPYESYHVWDVEMGIGDKVAHDGLEVECGQSISKEAVVAKGGQWD